MTAPEGSAKLLYGIIFAENCMKMKKKVCEGPNLIEHHACLLI